MGAELTLSEYLAILRRRIAYLAVPFVLVASAGILVSILLPPIYRSTGLIQVSSQRIPQDFIRSTITALADERIEIIRQRITTRQTMLRLAERYGIFDDRPNLTLTERAQEMRDAIRLEALTSSVSSRRNVTITAFSLSYDDRNPLRARRVANELVTLFLEENVRTRTRRASETTDFLEQESEKLRRRLEDAEQAVAAFKQQNRQSLPEQLQLHQSMLQRAESDLSDIQRKIDTARSEIRFFDLQIDNSRSGVAPPNDGETLTPERELIMLQQRWSTLRTLYTSDHPSIRQVERRMRTLRDQLGYDSDSAAVTDLPTAIRDVRDRLEVARDQFIDDARNFGDDSDLTAKSAERMRALERTLAELEQQAVGIDEPAEAGTNPLIDRLMTQRQATEQQLASLIDESDRLRERIDDLERRILRTPEVERELIGLSRGYQSALEKYEDVRSKQLDAQLAESLESGQKAERFTLLEAPILPEDPVKPNRPLLILASLAVGLLIGIGCVVVVELLHGTVNSPSRLAAIIREPPLAVIPYIDTIDERLQRRRRMIYTAGAATILLAVGIGTIHLTYLPIPTVIDKVIARF